MTLVGHATMPHPATQSVLPAGSAAAGRTASICKMRRNVLSFYLLTRYGRSLWPLVVTRRQKR